MKYLIKVKKGYGFYGLIDHFRDFPVDGWLFALAIFELYHQTTDITHFTDIFYFDVKIHDQALETLQSTSNCL